MSKIITFVVLILVFAGAIFAFWFRGRSAEEAEDRINRKDNIEIIVQYWNDLKYSHVLDSSEKYLKRYPEDSYIRLLRGISLLNIAHLGIDSEYKRDVQIIWEVIHEIRQALVISPNFQYKKEAYYTLGKAYYLLSGSYLNKAITYLELAIRRNVERNDVYDFLIQSYRDAKEYDQAISLVRERIEDNEDEQYIFNLRLMLIDLYLEIKDIPNIINSINSVNRLDTIDQQQAEIEVRKAQLLLLQNDLDSAISVLEDVVKEDPRMYRAFYYLGNAYNEIGDVGKARYQWRQALSIRPGWNKVIAKLNENVE